MDKNLRIQVLLGAVDKLTRPLKVTSAEAKKASAALKVLNQRKRELEARDAKINGFRRAKVEAQQLSAKLVEARTRATALGHQFAQTDAPTKRLAADFKAARTEVTQLEQRQRAQQKSLNDMRSALEHAGASTLNLDHHQTALRRDTHDVTREIEREKKALESATDRTKRLAAAQKHQEEARERSEKIAGMGTKAVAVGAGLAAPFVLATRQAMRFEAEMANVKKIVDFTPAGLADFNARLLTIGTRRNLQGPEIAQIAGQGAMGGVTDKSELLKFSDDAALLKEALNFQDATQAGAMAAGWRHAFNIRQDQVHELGDVITGLTRKWGAKEGKGEEIGQVLASVGTISQVAGAGRKQTAALAAVLSSMNVEAGVASTGIRNLMINLTRGAAATGPQKKAYKALGMDAVAMSKAMQDDAGGAIVSLLSKVKALPRAAQAGVLTQMFGARSIGPIGSLLERLDRVKEALGYVGDKANYTGQMEIEWSRKNDTTTASLKHAKAEAVQLAIIVGNQLLPAVRRGAEWFGRVAGRVSAWAAAHPKLARAITIGALALAAFLIVAGGVALIFASLLGPLAMLNVAFAEGSPAMLLFGKMGGLLTRIGPLVARAFLGMAAGALEFGAALLLNPVTWIVAGIAGLAALAFLVWKNWKPITAFFSRLWGDVRRIFGGVMAWFGGLGGRFAEFGRNMMQGLINGVMGMVGAVGKAIGHVGGQVVDGFKTRLGIHSPSRVFAQLGDHTMAGLLMGLERSRAGPLASVGRLAAHLAAALAVSASGSALAAPPGAGPGIASGSASQAAARIGALPALTFEPPATRDAAAPAGSRGLAAAFAPHIEVHVHAAKGMDEGALAREVARAVQQALTKAERRSGAQRLSSFADRGRD